MVRVATPPPVVPLKPLIGSLRPLVLADFTFRHPSDLTRITVCEYSGTKPCGFFFYDPAYQSACFVQYANKSPEFAYDFDEQPDARKLLGFEFEIGFVYGGPGGSNIWFGLELRDGSKVWRGAYLWNLSNDTLQIHKSDDTYENVATISLARQLALTGSKEGFPGVMPFHTFKILVDLNLKKFVGIQVNRLTYDHSTYDVYSATDTSQPKSHRSFIVLGAANWMAPFWIRRWKVTALDKW